MTRATQRAAASTTMCPYTEGRPDLNGATAVDARRLLRPDLKHRAGSVPAGTGGLALALAWRYVLLLIGANLVWEATHVRLYTLWAEASAGAVARAVLHCMAGDGLLGAAALGLALTLTRARRWPAERFGRVAFVATLLGVVATVAIEWFAVEAWGRWAYAPAMPRLPPLGTGLTPLLQWLVLPPLCLWSARRLAPRSAAPSARESRGAP